VREPNGFFTCSFLQVLAYKNALVIIFAALGTAFMLVFASRINALV